MYLNYKDLTEMNYPKINEKYRSVTEFKIPKKNPDKSLKKIDLNDTKDKKLNIKLITSTDFDVSISNYENNNQFNEQNKKNKKKSSQISYKYSCLDLTFKELENYKQLQANLLLEVKDENGINLKNYKERELHHKTSKFISKKR